MSDRDDELGRRVGVLLAPPEGLQARPDAGPLLRSRARTVTRVRRGVAFGAASLVAAVAVALTGQPAPDRPPASTAWIGAGWLTTPVEVSAASVADDPGCAGSDDLVRVGPDCLRVSEPALVVRRVVGMHVVPRAGGAASVELELDSMNGGEFSYLINVNRGRRLVTFVRGEVRGAAPVIADQRTMTLEITMDSVADAEQLAGELDLQPGFPWLGPGQLATPLAIRPVLRHTSPPCSGPAVGHEGECLILGPAVVAIRSVRYLDVLGPDRSSSEHRILIEFEPADGATFGAYTAAHRGQRIVLEIRGRLVGGIAPAIEGRIEETLEIPLRDYDEVERVVTQLRPSPDTPAKGGG